MEREFCQMSKRLVIALVITLLIAPSLFAQVELNSEIQGTVKDPQGAVVSGATVELTGSAIMAGKTTTTTDSSGYYRFPDLRPGTYTLSVSKTGFATQKLAVGQLAVGRRTNVDVTLKVGAATEIVEVTGQAPQIDISQSKVQTNVTQDILADVPKGRSFQSVIQFAPGARAEPLQGGPNNGVLGYQIDGATNGENSYMIEGQETSHVIEGDSETNVPMEFTQEVVIKSSGFEAEHGTASIGGIVNVIQKRGSNEWHGSVFTYYSGDKFDSAPNPVNRDSGFDEQFQPKKDHYRIWEPGFEVGGFLLKDKLWAFMSTVPRLYRQERTVFMTSANADRTFSQARDTYYSLIRLDGNPYSKLHVYGTWQYNYDKLQGNQLPDRDPVPGSGFNLTNATGQAVPPVAGTPVTSINNTAGNNVDNYNFGIGYKAPNMILGAGGDWTPTSSIVVSSRYGRVYTNYKDVGRPSGLRYVIENTTYPNDNTVGGADATTRGLDGSLVSAACAACLQSANYSNMASNVATIRDETKRTSWGTDVSYFRKGWGTHNFKAGYLLSKINNDAAVNAINFAQVFVSYICGIDAGCPGAGHGIGNGTPWEPAVSTASCQAIIDANNANAAFAANPISRNSCRGNFGTVSIREGDETFGAASSTTHGLYGQDNWTIGHGVTLNIGVRFDKEHVPTFAAGLPGIDFSFGQKIAPRLGGSWDVLRNGKLKVYASYGFFFDIMKWDLPRGSFGGDYWHDCIYAMDSANFLTGFIPDRSGPGGTFCPPSGGAAGVTTGGRFIANENFRVPSNDPSGACDAVGTPGSCVALLQQLFPTKQHEIVVGADWQIKPMLTLATRWSRKRLDRTVEDAAILSSAGEGYGIVNPGFGIDATTCTGCPPNPKAIRRYDGLEFRLTKAASSKWYGQASYTYSKLEGNYSGLTATDISDGGGGRQGGDVSRAFDEPMYAFDAHGVPIDGRLATDRPHALKAQAYYRLKYWKMETVFGGFQQLYSGSPLSSYLGGVFGTNVYPEGRGNWVNFTKAANGDFVPGDIIHDMRTPVFSQTDFSVVQEFHVSKNNENLKLGFEANFTNLLNSHTPTFIRSRIGKKGLTPWDTPANYAASQTTPPTDDIQTLYAFLLNGNYNYVNELNGLGVRGLAGHDVVDPRYGFPYGWQVPRSMRFKIRFNF
ncbi:MAG TPA: carboxypeptidase regulatory-like domain-containing protein [Terriglobales bacterium]|nr:carboxypeptidase regulatory-like domain-containing protein [Terriglobales bacterium]